MHNLVSLFNRPRENAPVVAKLGKKNEMYYNQRLKRWVEPGTEEQVEKEMEAYTAPPPKMLNWSNTIKEPAPESLSAADKLCKVVNLYAVGPGAHDRSLSRPKVPVMLPTPFLTATAMRQPLQSNLPDTVNSVSKEYHQDLQPKYETAPYLQDDTQNHRAHEPELVLSDPTDIPKKDVALQHIDASCDYNTTLTTQSKLISSTPEELLSSVPFSDSSYMQNNLVTQEEEVVKKETSETTLRIEESFADGSHLDVNIRYKNMSDIQQVCEARSVTEQVHLVDQKDRPIPVTNDNVLQESAYLQNTDPLPEIQSQRANETFPAHIPHPTIGTDISNDESIHHDPISDGVRNRILCNVSSTNPSILSPSTHHPGGRHPPISNPPVFKGPITNLVMLSTPTLDGVPDSKSPPKSFPLNALPGQPASTEFHTSHSPAPNRTMNTQDYNRINVESNSYYTNEITYEKTADYNVLFSSPNKESGHSANSYEPTTLLSSEVQKLESLPEADTPILLKDHSTEWGNTELKSKSLDGTQTNIGCPSQRASCTSRPIESSTVMYFAKEMISQLDILQNHLQKFIAHPTQKKLYNQLNESLGQIITSYAKTSSQFEKVGRTWLQRLGDMKEQISERTKNTYDEDEVNSLQSAVQLRTTVSARTETLTAVSLIAERLKRNLGNIFVAFDLETRLERERFNHQIFQHIAEKELKSNECLIANNEVKELSHLLQKHDRSWKMLCESSIRSVEGHFHERLLHYEQILLAQHLNAEERLIQEQSSMRHVIKGLEDIRECERKQKEQLHQKLSTVYSELKNVKYQHIAIEQQKDEIISKLTIEKQELETDIATVHAEYESRISALKRQYAVMEAEYQQIQLKYNQVVEHSSNLSLETTKLKEDHQQQILHLTNEYDASTNELHETINALALEKCSLEKRTSDLMAQMDTLRGEKASIESSVQDASLRNNKLETAFAKIAAEKMELSAALERLEAQCTNLSNERMKLLSEIQIQSENMGKEAQAFIEDKEKAVNSLKGQIDGLEQQLSAVAVEKDMAKRELNDYTQEVSVRIMAMQETHKATETSLRDALSALNEKYTALEGVSQQNEQESNEKIRGLEEKIIQLDSSLQQAVEESRVLVEKNQLYTLEKEELEKLSQMYSDQKRFTEDLENKLSILEAFTDAHADVLGDVPPASAPDTLESEDPPNTSSPDALQTCWNNEREAWASKQEEIEQRLEESQNQLAKTTVELKRTTHELEVTSQKQLDSAFMLEHMAMKWDILLNMYPDICHAIDAHISSNE